MSPLFAVRPLAWRPPDEPVDALFFTSANAPRHAGAGGEPYRNLPCYCVGEATAATASLAGFATIRTGPSDGAAALALAAADGIGTVLHMAGREHLPLEHPGVRVERRLVYAAEPLALSSEAVQALRRGALPLLHSPRAAEHFADLVDEVGLSRSSIPILAISAAAAARAGSGWAARHVAPEPRDAALLALAAQLCQNA